MKIDAKTKTITNTKTETIADTNTNTELYHHAGTIPPSWFADGSFPSLQVLSISKNMLSGTLPATIHLPRLMIFMATANNLTGAL
jgi:hypothetical protein